MSRFVFSAALLLTYTLGSAEETHLGDGFVSLAESLVVSIAPGDSVLVAIPIIVAEGYHVQSNPASNEFFIPLELQFNPTPDFFLGAPSYPEWHPYRLQGAKEDLWTYRDTVLVHIGIKRSQEDGAEVNRVAGTLRYQACNDRRCFFPSSIPVTLTVVTPDSP